MEILYTEDKNCYGYQNSLKEEGVVLNYLLAEPADCTRKNTVTEPANLVPIYRSRSLEDRAVTTTVGNNCSEQYVIFPFVE